MLFQNAAKGGMRSCVEMATLANEFMTKVVDKIVHRI